jgi:hypothetical protein
MNIAKMILGYLNDDQCSPKALKELIRILYAVFNNQNGNKLPDISDDLLGMAYNIVLSDYCKEMLENWSVDYERSRTQPQRPPNFTNDIHSKILSGLGKETGGKV